MKEIKKVLMFLVCLLALQGIEAQITVSGVITDADTGAPIPAITVVEEGTTNGTSADFDGNYTIDVPSNATLRFSSIGYTTQSIAVNGRTTINVVMQEDTEMLGEVVVTALGIKKETRALGYSITEVAGEEISEIKQVNAINSLQGKIAGVNITQNATGAAGSSRIVIRGPSSFGNNQPLYVVDGIPIGNDNNGSAGEWGGADGGDGIASLNSNDVESVSVLKGGAASALYGSRAANGVILITTKSGAEAEGFGVEFNSTVTIDQFDTSIQDFQREYGQGTFGEAPGSQDEALEDGYNSWGSRLNGGNVVQWDGTSRPYTNRGDNGKKFYRTGTTFFNTVAITDANEKTNYRFSATDITNTDIIPGASLNRKIFALNLGSTLAEKLTLNVNAKYSVEKTFGRPRLSDSPGNANFSVALLPANINVEDLAPGTNEDGSENLFTSNVFSQNPYFAANNFRNEDTRNRFIGSASLRYDITDWLYIFGRAGIDQYTRRGVEVEPYGTGYKPLGGMNDRERRYSQVDSDIMIGVDKDVTEKIGISAFVGANRNKIESEELTLGGNDFIVPGLEDIGNLANQSRSRTFSERAIGSVYGSAEFSYDGWAFLTVTGRNDWFSTLSFPGKETSNNEFYPSVNASVVLSDALDLPNVFDFLKLRGGYSEVAGGADEAYQLALTYQIFGQGHLGQPLGRISNSSLPNANLVPFSKKETEVGLDARMFNNRLTFDVAYYTNESSRLIVGVASSFTSGFQTAEANLGVIENKGFEFLIGGRPIVTENFTWNTSINGSYNSSEVVSTNADESEIQVGQPRTFSVEIKQIVGERFGTIKGRSFERDAQGRIVYDIDSDGVPLAREAADREILGEGIPPLTLGWTNTLTYKDWSLNFLIDGKFGGQIYSGTNAIAYGNGLHKATLEGRESGLTVTGVDAATGNEFTATVAPENLQTYYGRINDFAEPFVEDADYIKFRQLALGYSVPSRFLENTFLQSVNVQFTAQNLFYLMRSVDNIDPEAAYNAGNAQGLEYFGVPPTRTYGFNLNVKF